MDATRSSETSGGARRRSNRGIGIVTAADSRERSLGQLHVYDGDGKGKSQAALGVVLRTIGLGICEQRRTRVLLLRFLKGPGRAYDEDAAIEATLEACDGCIERAARQLGVAASTLHRRRRRQAA